MIVYDLNSPTKISPCRGLVWVLFTALSPAPETVSGATHTPNTLMPQVCCAPRYSPAHRDGLLQVSSLEGVYLRPPTPDPVGSTHGPPLPSFLGFTASQMGDTRLPCVPADIQNMSHVSIHHPCTKFHYIRTHMSWSPHRHMSCDRHCHTCCLIHTFNTHSFSACCVPGAIPGNGNTAVTNTDKIPALEELTSWLGKWTVDRSEGGKCLGENSSREGGGNPGLGRHFK